MAELRSLNGAGRPLFYCALIYLSLRRCMGAWPRPARPLLPDTPPFTPTKIQPPCHGAAMATFEVGAHVRVHGLVKAKKLNGSLGLVVVAAAPSAAAGGGTGSSGGHDGRLGVRLKSGRTIQVKPANLRAVPLVGGQEPRSGRYAREFDAATCLEPFDVEAHAASSGPPVLPAPEPTHGPTASAASAQPATPGGGVHVDQEFGAEWERRSVGDAEVPRELHPFVYRRSADGHETSLLVLLHGSGSDAPTALANFGGVLDGLPQTSVLAVTGPFPLGPLMGAAGGGKLPKHAATWLPVIDTERQEALPEPAFRRRDGDPVDLRRLVALENRTRPLLRALLLSLVTRCGWRLHEIFLIGAGFGEGSAAAVDVLLHLGNFPLYVRPRAVGAALSARPAGPMQGLSRLGGVVAIDGVLPPELGASAEGCGRLLNYRPHASAAAAVPVLLVVGDTGKLTQGDAQQSAARLRTVLRGGEDGGPQEAPSVKLLQVVRDARSPHQLTAPEVSAIHRFFGEHLVQRPLGLEADAGVFQVRGGMGPTEGVGVAAAAFPANVWNGGDGIGDLD